MRISWRELDWISERDRHEIERRMHLLGGDAGLLDRVDFSGRASDAAGPFEIRITANAAKRQIIAVRRDPQRVKAFNSAFEALERSVVSVLKTQPLHAEPARAAPARAPALALDEPPSLLRNRVSRRALGAALALAVAMTALAWFAQWGQRGPREVAALRQADVGARAEAPTVSAVARIAAGAREDEPAYWAVARIGTARR